jgi:hypothetical protein
VDKDYFKAQGAYEEAMRTIQVDPNGLFASHTAVRLNKSKIRIVFNDLI